jgi:hypothetical protein
VVYFAIAALAVVIAAVALVFILGSRAMAQSRSDNGDSDDR